MPTLRNQQELDITAFVDNKLIFGNHKSGQIKKIKMGFSFPTFFFDWLPRFDSLFVYSQVILLEYVIISMACSTNYFKNSFDYL